MVLGTSDVRLIDMTSAFASVSNKGVAVMPYGIRKVVSADGRLLYQNEQLEERVLVAPWVAAEMTDLLQSAVLTGTGRAAQIGRPVAGKTGTTSSNKDGWFIGFSSGMTAGVWMGRDDAKAVGNLQGGTAPARAFHDFMVKAVANRPVESFETQVPMPDWELDPEEEAWSVPEGANGMAPMVDEYGRPYADPYEIYPQGQGIPTDSIPAEQPFDPARGGAQPDPYRQPQQQPRPAPPSSQPRPRSEPADDTFEAGADTPQ
jgi:penicillin-binding protein 1A